MPILYITNRGVQIDIPDGYTVEEWLNRDVEKPEPVVALPQVLEEIQVISEVPTEKPIEGPIEDLSKEDGIPDNLMGLLKDELIELAKKFGLEYYGNKSEIAERLEEYKSKLEGPSNA